jgi:hypothetical protein
MAYTYTDLEFEHIKQMYAGGASLEDILVEHPTKSVASIRMKLVKAKVYVAKAPGGAVKQDGLKAYQEAEALVGLAPF